MSHTQRALEILTYEELLELRAQIEQEIRRREGQARCARFKPGDQVTFIYQGTTRFATVIRVNTKTVTLVEHGDNRGTWRVSPSLVTPIHSAHSA